MAYLRVFPLFGFVLIAVISGLVIWENVMSSYRPVTYRPVVQLSLRRNLLAHNRSHFTSEKGGLSPVVMETRTPSCQSVAINKSSVTSRSSVVGRQDYKQNHVNVAFFEGFRRVWLYRHVFQPSFSKEVCNCSTNCYVTKKLISKAKAIKNYDLVVFVQDVSRKGKSAKEWNALTKTRSQFNPKQQWIYATRECVRRITPAFPPKGYTSSVYNMSVTYHSNSTITIPYGYFTASESVQRAGKNWASEKKHLVAWMSSAPKRRPRTWRRAEFVQHLGKYIDIHLYGRSRERRCPSATESCDTIISRYKFYLSFENNCCEEYITEKFWRTLTLGVVPVVIGAPKENYLRLAPPNSFIYADDFKSAKELADYLMLLDSNDNMYNRYLEWKEKFEAINNFPDRPERVIVKTIPPPNFVYSCNSVCKMAGKYIENEKKLLTTSSKDQSKVSSHFDPLTSWWGGSCRGCGTHSWIRQFSEQF